MQHFPSSRLLQTLPNPPGPTAFTLYFDKTFITKPPQYITDNIPTYKGNIKLLLPYLGHHYPI
jgi:hypothetical protein